MSTARHQARKKARAHAARASRRAPGERWRKRVAVAGRHYEHVYRLWRESEDRWHAAVKQEGRDSPRARALLPEMDALYRSKVQAEILLENVEKEVGDEDVSYRSPFYVRDAARRSRGKRRHAKARVRRARRARRDPAHRKQQVGAGYVLQVWVANLGQYVPYSTHLRFKTRKAGLDYVERQSRREFHMQPQPRYRVVRRRT